MNTAVTATVPSTSLRSAAPALARPGLMSRLGAGIWKALLAIGHARGRSHLRQLAAQFDGTRPEFAAELRRAAQRGWTV